MGRKKNFTGQNFWTRGYFLSTVGTDEKIIREYIRRQEKEDRHLNQLSMFEEEPRSGGQLTNRFERFANSLTKIF
jgi:putative transposase